MPFTDAELEAFDESQREILVTKFNELESSVEDRVQTAVRDNEGADEPMLDHMDEQKAKFYLKDQKKLKKMTQLWRTNGSIPGVKDRVEYEDLCGIDRKHTQEMQDNFSTDHPLLIPRVIGEVVKEAIEPNIVLTPLLQRINYSHGSQLTFPAVGAFSAADIPEGGEYPERSLDFAGQVVATIGKSGVAVKMTDEMIRYSLFDVMSMHLRAAGRAMVRWKEKKVADLILDNAGNVETANILFDNTATTDASTTGRDAAGRYNGSLALDDIFKAYATMVNNGFTPNALLMNPFAWHIFADEALMRAFGFQNAAQMWQVLQGGLGSAPMWSNGNFGNGLLQNTTVDDPQHVASTFTSMPSIFPYPFRIIVTPYMPYYATSNTTDMVLCDVSELGVLVVDEEIVTEAWDDPARDIQKVKLRERYAVASVNEGKGTGLFKGISLARNFDFAHNLQTTITTDAMTHHLSGDPNYVGAITTNTS